MGKLDPGEKHAIALALELHADLLLMDDRDGVEIARRKGFRVAGTLIVLAMAAQHGLLNLMEAFEESNEQTSTVRRLLWISFSRRLRVRMKRTTDFEGSLRCVCRKNRGTGVMRQ